MKKQKVFSIFMLLVMTLNIFNPFLMMVEAELSTVTELIEIVDNGYSSIQTKIVDAKDNPLYLTENSYKSALYTIELETSDLRDEIFGLKESLKTITLSSLIADVNKEELNTKYQRYIELGNLDFVLNVEELDTITFVDDDEETTDIVEETTLITIEELVSYIDSLYIEALNTKLVSYATNFDLILGSYVTKYSDYLNNVYNPALSKVTNYYNEVKDFEELEKDKNNNPDMLVEGTDIYELIDNTRLVINEKDGVFDVNKLDVNKTEIDNALAKLETNIGKFYANNKSYLELDLDDEINTLTNDYQNVINSINTWYTSKGIDSTNIDYSLLSTSIDASFKTLINSVYDLEDDCNSLNEKITTYLKRKPSDKESIDLLLSSLDNQRLIMNKDIILDLLENTVENADLTSEDTVDNLYFINDLKVSSKTKKLLVDAKKSFYSFDITGTENKVLEEKVIFYGVSSDSGLNFEIDYQFKNEVVSIDGKHFIKLYDRNDWLVYELEIVIAGDFNENYEIDEDDLKEIHELTVSKSIKKSQKLLGDLNKDSKVDVKDLSIAKKLMSNKNEVSNATTATLKVVKVESGNTISYKIYLESNGVVDTFSYKVKVTNDLVFKTLKTEYNVLANSKTNPTNIVGYGDFKDGDLLATLVYEKEDNNERFTGLQITEGLIICDNKLEVNKVSANSIVENEIEEKVEVVVDKQVESNEVEEVKPIVEQKEEATQNNESKENEENKVVVVEDLQEEDKIDWKSIVKIVVVVLLGGSIIYFLSKDDSEEPFEESAKKQKKNK